MEVLIRVVPPASLDTVQEDKGSEGQGVGLPDRAFVPGFGLSSSNKPRKTDEHPPGCSPRGESLTGIAVIGRVPSGLDLSDSDKARRTDELPPGRSPCGEDRTGMTVTPLVLTDNVVCVTSCPVATLLDVLWFIREEDGATVQLS